MLQTLLKSMRRLRIAALLGAGLGVVLSGAAGAQAASKVETPREINIPAGSLIDALDKLGDQSGVQIMFETALARGVKVEALNGTYSVRAALAQLLSNTGLQVDSVNDRTVVLKRVKSLSSSAGGEMHMAQVAAEPGEQTNERGSAVQAGAGESNSSGEDKVQEILVTAQKRSERLQDVPIAISVLRGEQLDTSSAQSVNDALNRVPGVLVQESLSLTRVTVRGVGVSPNTTRSSGSSPIAYYLDSVPFGFAKSAFAPDASAYDLDRVEVLRGPQGTLYGSSALNGVVRVLTKDADPNAVDFKARTSASSTQDGSESYRGDIAVNVPIVEGKLAARAVAGYQDIGGWIDRPNRGEEDANSGRIRTARLKLKAQPIEGLSIDSLAWFSRGEFAEPNYSIDGKINASRLEEPSTVDYDVYGLKVAYDFPAFTVTSSTSYIDFRTENYADFSLLGLPAGTRLQTLLKNHLFAEELVLTSTREGPWRWSVGGMYRDSQDRTFYNRLGYVVPGDGADLSKSFAVFGEVTRAFLGGRFELTAGARYFEDDVSQTEFSRQNGFTPLGHDPGDTFDALSPRVVLTWHPSEQLNLYTSYSEGFRSGVLQAPLLVQVAPYMSDAQPDQLTNYELGAKGSLFGGRVSFDTAVYYMDWQDVQQSVLVTVPGISSLFSATINGVSASGMGFDFGLSTEPLEGLQLGANLSWNDLQFDADVLSNNIAIIPQGARPNSTPELTYGLSADYGFPLGTRGFRARLSAAANYISEQTTTSVTGASVLRVSSDAVLIGRAGFAVDAPQNWTATLFVDNVNDERGILSRSPNSPQWHERLRPRTIGVQLEYRFQ